MKASAEWESVPEGVEVSWKGLRMREIITLSEDERRKLPFVSRLPSLPVVFFGLALVISLASIISDRFGEGRALVWSISLAGLLGGLCACFCMRPKPNRIGVFVGNYHPKTHFGRFGKVVKKLGLENEELVVRLTEAGTVASVNGTSRVLWALDDAPVYVGQRENSDSLSLTVSEVFEIRKRLQSLQGYFWFGAMIVVGVCARLSSVPHTIGVERLNDLLFSAVFLFVGIVMLFLVLRERSTLRKDLVSRQLEKEANALVLKHSRKPWTINGNPASWRLKKPSF